VSAAQICTRYILERNCVVAAGTGANASTVGPYAVENLGVYDFQLTSAEVSALDAVSN